MANEVDKKCERSGFWFLRAGIVPTNDELADIDKNLCGFIVILQKWTEFKDIERPAGEDVFQSCYGRSLGG